MSNGYVSVVPGGCNFGVLHAVRLCNGGNWLHPAKNAGNIIMKNLMDFCIGTVVFVLLGYAL